MASSKLATCTTLGEPFITGMKLPQQDLGIGICPGEGTFSRVLLMFYIVQERGARKKWVVSIFCVLKKGQFNLKLVFLLDCYNNDQKNILGNMFAFVVKNQSYKSLLDEWSA